MSDVVIIQPRTGITPEEIVVFLREQFQFPGQSDGNPLINATIVCAAAESAYVIRPT